VILALVCLSVVAGCGEEETRTGGTANIVTVSFPDFLDPALSYTSVGWQALTQAYPGLLVFPHESGTPGSRPQPGLAEALPEISADGRTYRLKLRDGLRFADGSPLQASDFKASVERVLALDSPGAALGYTNIVGAERYLKSKQGGIEGIRVNDATGQIQIRLVEPRGVFTHELAVPFAGVVPADTPARNMTKDPPPGAGRYAIADVTPGRSFTLRQNQRFSESLDGTPVDAGRLDAIRVEVIRSAANATTRVSQGKADFFVDEPPADRVRELKQRFGDRFRQFSTNSLHYFFLNTEAPPFDDVKVRQAANHAIDPEALSRLHGGTVTPWHHLLPPGLRGGDDAADPTPYDPAKARRLIRSAGAEGEKVTIWGPVEEPAGPAAEYYADALEKVGLDTAVKLVPFATYAGTVGDRSLKAQTGWFNWTQDYPHPAIFVDNMMNPDNVVETGNVNLSYNAADRGLAGRINAVAEEPELTESVDQRWQDLATEIERKSYLAAFGTERRSTFMSDRMNFKDCRGDEWPPAIHDWAQFCFE
jgi:peptide/nickel transport system substrate-binding protein